MMQLSLTQINEVVEVQRSLSICYDGIKQITALIEQLLNYQCSVKVKFSLVNETLKAEARAKKEAEEQLKDPWEKHMEEVKRSYGQGIEVFVGMMRHSCTKDTDLQFPFSEAEAIVLLNQVLTMRRAEKSRLIAELKRLTKNTMAASLYIDEDAPIKP